MENLITENWDNRLLVELPQQSAKTRESIVRWLLGKDVSETPTTLTPSQLKYAEQMREYRYRILQGRYLGVNSQTAYRNLITRLGSFVILRNKIRAWVAVSRDRQRSVIDVLEEVIQELLQSDRHLGEEIAWIAKCTSDPRLKNALLLTVTEEYCLRPIRNQPLIAYRFINYLRRTSRGGLTYVPTEQLVRLVSDEMLGDDQDNFVSLVDYQAYAEENNPHQIHEQQDMQIVLQNSFSQYLSCHIGEVAVQWLTLHLQGYTPKAIAEDLNMSVQQVYRLREKICYHAREIFSKQSPELLNDWLDAS